jgi:hypothetical protein
VKFNGFGNDTSFGVLHESTRKIRGKSCSTRFQISSSCRWKECEGDSFAHDFQFEKGLCWEGVFQN